MYSNSHGFPLILAMDYGCCCQHIHKQQDYDTHDAFVSRILACYYILVRWSGGFSSTEGIGWMDAEHSNSKRVSYLLSYLVVNMLLKAATVCSFELGKHPYYKTESWFLAASNDETRIYVFSTPLWVLTKGPQKNLSWKIWKTAFFAHFCPFLPIFAHFLL